MAYEIQSRTRKNNLLSDWRNDEIGEPNTFTKRAAAQSAIRDLQSLGDDWAAAEYRVVETTRA